MDTREEVSRRIQQLCAAHGYNVNALARKSGVPPTTLKNIIYGNSRNPGVVTIKLICDGLEISLFDFFDSDVFRQLSLEDIGWQKQAGESYDPTSQCLSSASQFAEYEFLFIFHTRLHDNCN